MAEKRKNNSTKSARKVNSSKRPVEKKNQLEEKEVKIIQASHDYTNLIKRIIICMYIIIGLLVVIGIIMVVSPKVGTYKSSASEDEVTEEEELGDYDVSMFESITTDNLAKSVTVE